ncbi:MAG: HAD-IA family hydrolase [Candidatus Verstraetearchaeota archaeon]|nr:HAD-IA family hydrolase [Candidatus Verstraetearchaeota archaeon]
MKLLNKACQYHLPGKDALIRGAIFDLDGTLVDSTETIWRTSDHTLKMNGFRGIDRKTVEKVMGLTIFDLFLQVEPDLNEAQKRRLFEDYKKSYMNFIRHTKVLPNACEALEDARSRGLKMALVTTKSRENAEMISKFFGMRKFFDVVLGFEDTTEHKPSPEPISKAAFLLDLKPEAVVVVGDTEMDVRAGRRAGSATVAVTTGVTPLERLLREKPDYLINSLSEMPEIFRDLAEPQGR